MTCFYVHDPALSLVPLPRDVVASLDCKILSNLDQSKVVVTNRFSNLLSNTSPYRCSLGLSPSGFGRALLTFLLTTLVPLIFGLMLVVIACTVPERRSVRVGIGAMTVILCHVVSGPSS